VQVEGRRPFGRDWYVLSDRPVDFAARAGQEPPDIASAPNHGALLVASVGGERYRPKLLDHGEVYASKAFRAADGRIIWWGWAFESSAGCEGMCGSGTPFTQALVSRGRKGCRHAAWAGGKDVQSVRMVCVKCAAAVVAGKHAETCPGCPAAAVRQGWQGAQTLPREVTYDAAAASLLLNPVAEVERLRQRQLFDGHFDLLGSDQASGAGPCAAWHRQLRLPALPTASQPPRPAPLPNTACLVPAHRPLLLPALTPALPMLQRRTLVEPGSPPAAASQQPLRRVELLLRFNLSSGAHPSEGQQRFRFSLGAAVELGGGARLLAGINGSAADDSAAGAVVTDAQLWVDTRGVGGATQGTSWGGPAELPRGGLPARDLELRLFLDGSLVEAYGLGGRQRVTVRAYPLDAAASWGVALLSHAPDGMLAAHARVWEMGSCWVDELDLPAAAAP
jgi:hypothetical protein